MLSFFSKKKHSPDTPPEEVIQGPESQNNGADDFIFVEKKPTEPEPPSQPASGMYPPMPPSFGMPSLPYPSAYPMPGASKAHSNNTPVPYVQGVPFEMSPQLCTKSAFEMTQLQVDGILAIMTRQMSVDDYSFALERSIQNECEY